MGFRVAQETLESLEWPKVVVRLCAHCRTPQARARLRADPMPESSSATGNSRESLASERPTPEGGDTSLFEDDESDLRERQAETTEARLLLNANELPPLDGAAELEGAFQRAQKGGVLEPQQLLAVRSTVAVVHDTARYLGSRADQAPRLAALAERLPNQRSLADEIEACIDPSGEVRDDASPELARARHDAHQLAGELQSRLQRALQSRDVAPYLSDSYYTLRNDRYVLPVKADFRGRVRGIVHDASNTGTTLFIEPEAVVELNNRLKQSELAAEREVQRVLHGLTQRVAGAAQPLRDGLEALREIDLAFARGHVSREMWAVEPALGADGVIELPQLRHPLLPREEAVANDLQIGMGFNSLILSGPNAGGKTVAMKAVGLAALLARAGLHVPAGPGARIDLVDSLLSELGDGQDIAESLSTFSAHMAGLAAIVGAASERSLVLLDEVGVGTDPGEGAALAQAVLETLADKGCRVIATTHYNLLKEMADVDPRFCNASVEFDPETLAPTYRLHLGTPGASSATAVAARMGMPNAVLERANALLDREDRQLDRMLSELSASRAALDEEQRVVSQLRAQSEAVRSEYLAKLERLHERRDKLVREMRVDLDRAFTDAHGQIASVIRNLQRGSASAQEAAGARSELLALQEQTREAQGHAEPGPDSGSSGAETASAIDWRQVDAGDCVRVPGGGTGILETLPDRRGRVRVKVGDAQLVIAADQVRSAPGSSEPHRGRRIRVEGAAESDPGAVAAMGGGTLHCDLRGRRVEDALDRLAEAVDRALAEARDELCIVHGFGTGALRRAVRESLARSPFVTELRPGVPQEGGDGVTFAALSQSKS